MCVSKRRKMCAGGRRGYEERERERERERARERVCVVVSDRGRKERGTGGISIMRRTGLVSKKRGCSGGRRR